MLTVRTGEQIWGLLDVLSGTFDKIPETLEPESKKDVVGCMEHAVTQRERVEQMAADAAAEEMPRT
ncbi:hypothetical protein SNOUR_05865 [Streptomyces noursei ATCC 11455]|nr:hypothetical protein SNOUR_05865 [Streptomyces noursei ATCC 11455]